MHHLGMFDAVFVAMLICCFAIRIPREIQNKRSKTIESREGAKGHFLLMLAFTGSTTMPLLYLFTPWFDFADRPVSMAQGGLGTLLAIAGAMLFWKSHHDLGRQFSPTLELREAHALVSEGIYRKIRHPMYTAAFTIGAAQLCLIGNFVVAPAFLIAFSILYFARINHEEAMLLEHFGSAYADYKQKTNRLLPALRR